MTKESAAVTGNKGRLRQETPEHPSAHQGGGKDKAKNEQYPKDDKNKTVREEHTNGSTPKGRL